MESSSKLLSADTYFLRGNKKIELGDYNGAISDYNKAINLKPDFRYAFYKRGCARNKLGQTRKAKSDFLIAVELSDKVDDVGLKIIIEQHLRLTRITFNPHQCGGRPCIRGMRIRVADVLGLLASGMSTHEILEEMPDLETEDIFACLQFAANEMDELLPN